MKHDVGPLPDRVPVKRRAIQQLADVHIAQWLDDDIITAAERRRLQGEKDRRRRRTREHRLGIVAADEGMTPDQLATVLERVGKSNASEVLHTRLPSSAYGPLRVLCRALEIGLTLRAGDGMLGARSVVHDANSIIAAPRELNIQPYATRGVWMMIGLARHRGLPVTVVNPAGDVILAHHDHEKGTR